MQVSSIQLYESQSNKNIRKEPVFKSKLTLSKYGMSGKKLKEIMENSVIGQKNSENTVFGLAILGLATLAESEEQVKNIRKQVSGILAKIRHSTQLEESRRKREEKHRARKEILQEMASCGMTHAEMGAKLELTPSGISGQMRKYGLKTNFSKKYDTELTEVRNNSPVLKKAVGENEKRKFYLQILKDYSNLNSKYKHLLVANYKKPDNTEIRYKLKNFEIILDTLANPNEIEYHKQYFEVLNTKYIDDFDNICNACRYNIKNGGSTWKFLALLKGEKISSEQLEEWTQYPEFNCDEFMNLRDFSSEDKMRIAKFKRKSHIINFDLHQSRRFDDRYTYYINFNKKQSMQERLLTIAQMHEALYNEPAYFGKKEIPELYEPIHVRDEIYTMLKRDIELNSIYALAKYLNFEGLEKYNYFYDDIIKLQKDSPEYNNLKNDIAKALFNFDISSEKVGQLVYLLNRKDLFEDIMDGAHAIMRFITRFVLKNNYSTKNLIKETEQKTKLLRNVLEESIDENKSITLCKIPSGTSPQFYLAKSPLGYYVSVTIGKEGKIHTLYEDKFKYDAVEKMKKENSFQI